MIIMFIKYKRYRNTLTKILKTAKKNYYSHLFSANANNSVKTWKIKNNVLGKETFKSMNCIPENLSM